ncbi:hypothetical protein QBZ16_000157 [Prototheca wickerhamii]|uniref:TLC domain-containing protein n=1 Tax=Prototheca wickerhamii TaxID=3111 RepID=A0AAD9IN07_PROWI|nr:hypothetical protein QBZ16_000157 [Prototheca wickerhamii]
MTFKQGKAGSFVDDVGHFYKPLQAGPRGDRERAFYESIASDLAAEHMWRQSSRRKSLRWPAASPAAEALERLNIAQRDELGLIATSPGLSTPRGFSSDDEDEDGVQDVGSPSGHSEDELCTVAALITHGADRWGPRRSRSRLAPSNGAGATPRTTLGGAGAARERRRGGSLKADRRGCPGLSSSPFDAPAGLDGLRKTTPCRPFSEVHGPLLRVIPRFYGVVSVQDRRLLELEDLAREYNHPCIVDIKVGFQTWYPEAGDEAYIERCKRKDAATTQARLGFKICGMQDVFGGPNGAVAQLQALLAWMETQTTFKFYSSSILLMYEGDATESLWKLIVYAALTVAGGLIIHDAGWLEDTTRLWSNWPHQPHGLALVSLYYFELAFYLASMFMLLWWEARRKDFAVMMLHHVVTATLIGLSLRLNFLRVGAVVMTLHDACDVFLEASKLAKYAGWDGLATALFAAFASAWAALRLVFFPLVVLRSTRVTIVEVIGYRPPCLSAFNGLLLSLLAMHCYWFLLILLVAKRRLLDGEIDDARED